MNQLVLLGILLAVVAIISKKLKAKGKTKDADFQYTTHKNLMTAAERSFYGVLTMAVGNEFQIFSKVRLADIVTPEKGLSKSGWQKAFNRIAAKHIDFVLCRKDNFQIACAIELNDSSHNAKNRAERDELVETVSRSAKMPFVKFPAKASYNLEEVKKAIELCGCCAGEPETLEQ